MTNESENIPPISADSLKRKRDLSGIGTGPRKRPAATDPFVHHGRHFGRTVLLMCNVDAIINSGLLRLGDEEALDSEYSPEENRAWRVFNILLQTVPNLEVELAKEDSERNKEVADLIQKGVNGARADDTRSLKISILDWITDADVPLNPPLSRNHKSDRGFCHPTTGSLLCPTGLDWDDPSIQADLRDCKIAVPGDQWPRVLWQKGQYEAEDPWKGLLRNSILVKAFQHIFFSPSSLDKEPRATRSCNAQMHGMSEVTPASIVYISTQVRFALCSTSIFSKTDRITDSERFYFSLLDLLESPKFATQVDDLLKWWNRRVFPWAKASARPITAGSALDQIMKIEALKEKDLNAGVGGLDAVAEAAVAAAAGAAAGGGTV